LSSKKNEDIEAEEYFCYECGTIMDIADLEVLVCPSCHHSVDVEDYSTEEEVYEEIFGGHDNLHCIGCDGPWPVCTTTCELYNE